MIGCRRQREGPTLLTGELRNKIDRVWDAFWAGGIANPLEVIEQITYLLFIRGLDDAQTREENRANRLRQPMARRIFPEGKDGIGKDGGLPYQEMRWSRFKNLGDARRMYEIVSEHVFPFIRSMADADTASTPTANAMSVAIGIAQPVCPGVPQLKARYTAAGTTMPPIAAAMGSAAWRGDASSPAISSRLISSPTRRKKTVMSPSLIH